MIRVKLLPLSETAIIEDGKVYKFDGMGKCESEGAEPIVKYSTGSVSLPIVSVLSSNGLLDVAYFSKDGVMHRLSPNGKSTMEVVSNLQMSRGFLRMLNRTGTENGIKFNQLLFLYPEVVEPHDILMKIGLKDE